MIKVQLIGNIGQDATIVPNNGNPFCKFSVAVNDDYKDIEGNKVEKSTWVNCILNNAKHGVIPFLKKGVKVYVDGKLRAELWKNKDSIIQLQLNCQVNTIELCSAKKEDAIAAVVTGNDIPATNEALAGSSELEPVKTDDLPF